MWQPIMSRRAKTVPILTGRVALLVFALDSKRYKSYSLAIEIGIGRGQGKVGRVWLCDLIYIRSFVLHMRVQVKVGG